MTPEQEHQKRQAEVRARLQPFPKEVLVEFLVQNAWAYPFNSGKEVVGSVQDLAWEMEIAALKIKRDRNMAEMKKLRGDNGPSRLKKFLDLSDEFDKLMERHDILMKKRYPAQDVTG